MTALGYQQLSDIQHGDTIKAIEDMLAFFRECDAYFAGHPRPLERTTNLGKNSFTLDKTKLICGNLIFQFDFIKNTQKNDGTWSINWCWEECIAQWHVAENWWKAHLIIMNLRFLLGVSEETKHGHNVLSVSCNIKAFKQNININS